MENDSVQMTRCSLSVPTMKTLKFVVSERTQPYIQRTFDLPVSGLSVNI